MNNRGKLIEAVEFKQLDKPASRTASTVLYNGVAATTTSYLDTQGYDEVVISLNKGTFASGAVVDFSVVESADTDPSAATAVSGASFTQGTPSADDAVEVISIQCKDTKRYLWLKSDKTDVGGAAAVWGAEAVLGAPDYGPTPTTLVKADV